MNGERMPDDIRRNGQNIMFYLKKDANGYLALHKEGRRLINQFYKPPRQHGKNNLQSWLNLRTKTAPLTEHRTQTEKERRMPSDPTDIEKLIG